MPWCEILPAPSELFQAGNYPAAYAAQQQAVAKDSTNSSNYFNLSFYALFAGKPEAAIQAAQKTLSLNPAAKGVETNLALGYLLSGQWAEGRGGLPKVEGQVFS